MNTKHPQHCGHKDQEQISRKSCQYVHKRFLDKGGNGHKHGHPCNHLKHKSHRGDGEDGQRGREQDCEGTGHIRWHAFRKLDLQLSAFDQTTIDLRGAQGRDQTHKKTLGVCVTRRKNAGDLMNHTFLYIAIDRRGCDAQRDIGTQRYRGNGQILYSIALRQSQRDQDNDSNTDKIHGTIVGGCKNRR